VQGKKWLGGLWLARRGKMRGKTTIAKSVERDEGRDGMTGGRE
jgi:ribonucleotide reductase beta subunit family protein with ferritin-like domain